MSKKLIAGFMAALMAIVTVVSPVLATTALEDYPGILGEDGELDAYIVVGEAAATADVVGAVDLAVRLAELSYREVTVGEAVLIGAVSEEILLGDVIAGGTKLDETLKHYKLSGLQDDTITFQDEDYDFHEEIVLTTSANNLDIETSLTSGDDKYGSDVYLEIKRDAIKYYYVFDEDIDISTATIENPLEIEFLGKTLKITNVSAADTLTVQVGEEHTLTVGDSVTILGKTITLDNVGSSGTVVVTVDGVTETISQDTTKTVSGVKIKPIDYFYEDDKSERMATLVIGEETTKSYDDEDPYIGEDTTNPDWIWDLGSLDASGRPKIGIENDFVKDDYGDNPAAVGECYVLPNDFATVCLDSLTVTTFQTYEFAAETGIDLSDAWPEVSSANVLEITSPGEDEGIQLAFAENTNKTDTVYLKIEVTGEDPDKGATVSVFFVDTDGDVNFADNVTLTAGGSAWHDFAEINFQDTKGGDMDMKIQDANFTADDYFYLDLSNAVTSSDNLKMKWGTDGADIVKLGANADDSESDELLWSTTSIGTKDEDHRNIYGVVIKNPDSNGASDKVVLSIPADQVNAKVIVSGPGAEVEGAGEVEHVIVGITSAVAVLDTEVTSTHKAKNLVLVGGPCANTLVADLADEGKVNYTCDTWPARNFGLIQVIDDAFVTGKVALVAAGTTRVETRLACTVLQQYDTLLVGQTSSAVEVTSATSAGITAV